MGYYGRTLTGPAQERGGADLSAASLSSDDWPRSRLNLTGMMIRVYDEAGNVIATYEHEGAFKAVSLTQ